MKIKNFTLEFFCPCLCLIFPVKACKEIQAPLVLWRNFNTWEYMKGFIKGTEIGTLSNV